MDEDTHGICSMNLEPFMKLENSLNTAQRMFPNQPEIKGMVIENFCSEIDGPYGDIPLPFCHALWDATHSPTPHPVTKCWLWFLHSIYGNGYNGNVPL